MAESSTFINDQGLEVPFKYIISDEPDEHSNMQHYYVGRVDNLPGAIASAIDMNELKIRLNHAYNAMNRFNYEKNNGNT